MECLITGEQACVLTRIFHVVASNLGKLRPSRLFGVWVSGSFHLKCSLLALVDTASSVLNSCGNK